MFAGLAGQPLSVRRALRDNSNAPTDRAQRLPVGLPPSPYLSAWWRLAADEPTDNPVPRRGLPRAVNRSSRSPVGDETGPTGFTRRMVTAELPVRRSPDVAAVGPMLGSRESRRAPRRTAAQQPAPPGGDVPGPAVRRTDVLRAAAIVGRSQLSGGAPPAGLPSPRRKPPPGGQVGASPAPATSGHAGVPVGRAVAPRLTDVFALRASAARDRRAPPARASFRGVAQAARQQPSARVVPTATAEPAVQPSPAPAAAVTPARTLQRASEAGGPTTSPAVQRTVGRRPGCVADGSADGWGGWLGCVADGSADGWGGWPGCAPRCSGRWEGGPARPTVQRRWGGRSGCDAYVPARRCQRHAFHRAGWTADGWGTGGAGAIGYWRSARAADDTDRPKGRPSSGGDIRALVGTPDAAGARARASPARLPDSCAVSPGDRCRAPHPTAM